MLQAVALEPGGDPGELDLFFKVDSNMIRLAAIVSHDLPFPVQNHAQLALSIGV
jgi:hypothetical protein